LVGTARVVRDWSGMFEIAHRRSCGGYVYAHQTKERENFVAKKRHHKYSLLAAAPVPTKCHQARPISSPAQQVTDDEFEFRNDDPAAASEKVLSNTGPVLINPLENADHEQESNAVLLNGAVGPIRIGAETLESVLYT